MSDTIIKDKDGHPERWECAFCGNHIMLETTQYNDKKEVSEFCPTLGDIYYGDKKYTSNSVGTEMYVCSGCGYVIAISFEELEEIFGCGLTKTE